MGEKKPKRSAKAKVRKFDVYAKAIGMKFLGTFEAVSEEEAIEKALEEGDLYVSFCHQCSHELVDGVEVDAESCEAEEVE